MSAASSDVGSNLRNAIRRLRSAHGLTQAELAAALGAKQQTVAKWEAGETRPKLPELVALARRFNVTTDELLGLRPPEHPATNVETAIALDPNLTDRQRTALLESYRLARGRA